MNRGKPNRAISLFALAICLFSLSRLTVITASPALAHSTHSCVVFDYERLRWEHPLPATKLVADLNVGEPRTVRMIYFLPNDRQPQPDIDATFDTLIRQVQQSYAEQMENHGFGRRTFRFQTDADGSALVHHVKGKFDDEHYRTDMFFTVWEEVIELFDLSKNIYLVSLDVSDSFACGVATALGPESGMAVIGYKFFEHEHAWSCGNVAVIAHELGHTFGVAIDILALLAPENVSIPDGNLAAVLRETRDLAPGETVTQLEMLRIRNLNAHDRQITDLTGLEHAVNLIDLKLGWNEVQDITPLADLIILEVLDVRNNSISDIQPLMQMKNLQRLWLSGNSVSDLSPLTGLTSLKVISLSGNPIGSTTPLQRLLDRNPFLEMIDVTIAPAAQCLGDFDNNGIVNTADFLLFVAVFGTTC